MLLLNFNPYFLVVLPFADDSLAIFIKYALAMFAAITPLALVTITTAVIMNALAIGLIVGE